MARDDRHEELTGRDVLVEAATSPVNGQDLGKLARVADVWKKRIKEAEDYAEDWKQQADAALEMVSGDPWTESDRAFSAEGNLS